MQTEFPTAYGPTNTAQPARQTKSEEDEPSQFEKDFAAIREKGFGTFVKEMEDEKREKLREKILEAMGLSEDDLEKMPAEQRAAIEKMVAQEMQRRLSAEKMLDGEEPSGMPGIENAAAEPSAVGAGGSPPGFGIGPGVIQAIEAAERSAFHPHPRDEDEG